MNNIKKFLSLLFVAILALVLIGCGETGSNDEAILNEQADKIYLGDLSEVNNDIKLPKYAFGNKIKYLVDNGLDGIEVYHSNHTKEDEKEITKIIKLDSKEFEIEREYNNVEVSEVEVNPYDEVITHEEVVEEVKEEVVVEETVTEEVIEEVKEEVVAEEVKEEVVADVDYSKMTVAQLKEVAAEKEINVAGMKKAEIIEALNK